MLGSPVLSTCSEPLSAVGHSWEGLAYVHNCLSPVQEPRADLVRNAYEPAARSCRKLHGERRTSCHTSEMINMETDKIIDDTNTSQQVRVTRQSKYPRRFPSFVKRKKKLSPSCASPRPTDRPNESPVRWLFPARVLPPRYSRWNLNYQSVARDCPLYRRKREERDLDNEISFERTRVHLEHLFTLVNVWHLSKSFYITMSTFVVKLLSGL